MCEELVERTVLPIDHTESMTDDVPLTVDHIRGGDTADLVDSLGFLIHDIVCKHARGECLLLQAVPIGRIVRELERVPVTAHIVSYSLGSIGQIHRENG
jgi:hypothetical protein